MTAATERATETLVFAIYIKATPETVWEAITTSEFRRKYFFRSSIESTFQKGTPIRSFGPDGSTWGDNLVLESDPPRLLVHTWRSVYDPELAAEGDSRVSWLVEPQEGGEYTKLTVTHDQLDNAPKTAANVSGGWMFIISGLKTAIETGEPLSPHSAGQD
jgi:uncharacterized protein YndB with AHSA1/START domain